MALGTERTTFSLDILGRYTGNTWEEVRAGADPAVDPDAKPFDLIVIGGGTFGCALAARLFSRDKRRAHRILVLEAGPVALPEHVQNLPMLATTELWGLPWNSDSPKAWNQRFPGLAYCLGGRSVLWGGWSPHFIDSELPSPPWPASVVHDLTQPVVKVGPEQLSYLDHAAQQIGADSSNDFVAGPLHEAMRQTLFAGLKTRKPDTSTELLGNKGTPMSANAPDKELIERLEAPLAVESTSPRPGFLPFNKFSTVPLMVRTARMAHEEAHGSDVDKRLMVLGNTHVIRLERQGRRITRIVTNQGDIEVPEGGHVFLAMGTIENTRMALTTLPDANHLVGNNLMAHLRSNLTFRVRRSAFGKALDPALDPEAKELAVSALFVKGVHRFDDGTPGHFHIQITASGVGETGRDSEAELWKKVPDIDLVDRFKDLTDEWIVVTLRGIGEMTGERSPGAANRVGLGGPTGAYDYGQPRALVSLEAGPPGSRDMELWAAMDTACDELAQLFAKGGPIQYLSGPGDAVWQNHPPGPDHRRDTLSSTHHEGGTLWMGDDPATSVTDDVGRFHEADNLFALGPCLLPTLGSPNPVLSGIALARRTADKVVPPPAPPSVEAGFRSLFDGTDRSFGAWQAVGKGRFALRDGAIVVHPDGDLGLLFYGAEAFDDFVLRLEFLLDRGGENSGVFVRSRNPRRRVPDRSDPTKSYVYDNKAYVGVDTGFEVQIDEEARPDGAALHRTGAIYGIPVGPGPGQQAYTRGPGLSPGEWHEYEIAVTGNTYTVALNGQNVTTFTNTDAFRGRGVGQDPDSGFVGLQAHTGRVRFRNIRIKTV